MSSHAAILILTAALLPAGLTGCEERVVKTKNPFIGARRPDPPPPPSDGPIEATGKAIGGVVSGAGDLLFGWTRSNPQPTPAATPAPPQQTQTAAPAPAQLQQPTGTR